MWVHQLVFTQAEPSHQVSILYLSLHGARQVTAAGPLGQLLHLAQRVVLMSSTHSIHY